MFQKIVNLFKYLKNFLLTWLIIVAVILPFIKFVLNKTYKYLPDLGAAREARFGSSGIAINYEKEFIRISIPSIKAANFSGGILWQNWFTTAKEVIPYLGIIPTIDEQPINSEYIKIKIRGKHGGEKVELKIRNQFGEGMVVLGDGRYVIEKELKELVIPLQEFEFSKAGVMGMGFQRTDGIDGIVIGFNSNIIGENGTEIYLYRVQINDQPRNDWSVFLGVIFVALFVTSVFKIFPLLKIGARAMKVFISYSRADKRHLDDLDKHLASLKRERLIKLWYDREILPGDYWEPKINENLNKSRIILLIVTKNFIASEYCFTNEFKKAIEMHKQKKAIVIPLIFEECDWQNLELGKLQALPEEAKPVSAFKNRSDALTNIVKGIRKVVKSV